MSSRRSASDGTRIGTTDRRWNRSSRNCPSVIAWARSRLVEEMIRTSTWTRADAADALEILVDQHAQDLGLGLERHVGDFVEIERAAVRLFERPDATRTLGRSARRRTARFPCCRA